MCPAFGTEFSRGHSDTAEDGLWLNFATPAQCSGTAVEWRFCYYVQYSDNSQEVQLRVYRKNGIHRYTKILEDRIVRRYEGSRDLATYGASCDRRSPPFCCETLMISHQIQKNDIIGACMTDTGNYNPLYSIDEDAPQNYTVYQYSHTDDCRGDGQVQNFMTFNQDISLQAVDGYGLHAHLSITGNLISS